MMGKIIAVWGAPGSGKSVVAAKLAQRLAEQGLSVVLLFCDTTAPMLPCVCPQSMIERSRSLGSVFAAAHVTPTLVRNNLTTLKRSEKLTLLGLQKGESARDYPPCSERQAVEIISGLREIAEFVVVDCSSELDALTLAALEHSDTVLRLVSGELKSASYFASQLPAIGSGDAHIRVANTPRPLRALERVSSTLSKTEFTLPYCAELERQYSDGNLLAPLKSRDSRAFTRELDKIITTLENE